MCIKEFRETGCNQILLNDYHRKLDSTANFQLNFLPSDKQVYAFDYLGSGDHGIFANNEYYPKSENGYDFHYKSVETGKTDYVKVDFSNYNGLKDSVIFKDRYGIKLKLSKDNILTFTGTQKPDTNYIYAYNKDGVRIGKLMLKTYNPKTYNLVLVSVNGETLPNTNELKEYLNKIYKQSVTKFDISTTTLKINDLFPFKHGDKKRLSGYNEDQKRVLQAFDSQIKPDINYLFFMPDYLNKNQFNPKDKLIIPAFVFQMLCNLQENSYIIEKVSDIFTIITTVTTFGFGSILVKEGAILIKNVTLNSAIKGIQKITIDKAMRKTLVNKLNSSFTRFYEQKITQDFLKNEVEVSIKNVLKKDVLNEAEQKLMQDVLDRCIALETKKLFIKSSIKKLSEEDFTKKCFLLFNEIAQLKDLLVSFSGFNSD